MDTCVCLAESLRYTPETTTMLLMAIPQYKIKRFFFLKKKVDLYFLKKHKKKELVRKDKSLKKNEVEEEDTAGGYN